MKGAQVKSSRGSTAARDLGDLVPRLASDNLVDRLNARRRIVAYGSLAVPLLTRVLSDRRERVRWEAANALLQIGDRRSIPSLIRALQDKDANVRWVAAEGLIAMGDDSLMALFKSLLENHKSESLREGVHHVCHALARKCPPSAAARVVLGAFDAHNSDVYLPLALEQGMKLLQRRGG